MDSCSLNDRIKYLTENNLMYEGSELDRQHLYPAALISELITLDFLKYPYPIRFGGLGQTERNFHKLIRTIATVYPSLASVFINQTAFGSSPLLLFGTPEQIHYFLPGTLTGKLWLTLAFKEDSLNSHELTLTTTATQTTNGWSLTGKKSFVLNAPNMDYFLVLAEGITNFHERLPGIFIVHKDSFGISSYPSENQIGLASFPIHDLEFTNVTVPSDHLLGGQLAANSQFPTIIEQYTLLVAALTLGVAEGAYSLAMKHVTQKRQFGLTLISHHLIQAELVELDIRIESLKALISQVAKTTDSARSSSVAKINLLSADLSEYVTAFLTKFTNSHDSLADPNILRFKNDAYMSQLLGGPPQVQRDIIMAPFLEKNN